MVAEPLAVDLRVGEDRQHVVEFVDAPRRDELLEVLEQFADRDERIQVDLGVVEPDAGIGPHSEPFPIRRWRAEDLGDQARWQGSGDAFGELDCPSRFDLVEDPEYQVADLDR